MTGDHFPPAPSHAAQQTPSSGSSQRAAVARPEQGRRRSLALPFVSALLGGAVSGLAVWLAAPAATNRPQARALSESSTQPAPDATTRRLAALEQQLASLRRAASARQALAAYARAAETDSDDDKEAGGPGISSESPTFELAVRGVLDRIRAEQETEKEARRWQRRQNRAKDLTALLTEELRLTELQQREVESILAEQDAQYRELKREGADGSARTAVTPRQKRERNERIREETEQATERALSAVLDGEQLRRFREIRDEEELPPRD